MKSIKSFLGFGNDVEKYYIEYCMVGRLMDECKAFLGFGLSAEDAKSDCRYKKIEKCWGENVKMQVEALMYYYNRIPKRLKPKWCSSEEIENIKTLMLAS